MLCQHTEAQRNERYNNSRKAKKPLKNSHKNIALNFTSTEIYKETYQAQQYELLAHSMHYILCVY